MRLQFEGDERQRLIARFGLGANASDTDIAARVQTTLLAADQGGGDPPPASIPAGDPGESTEPPRPDGPTQPGGDPGTQGPATGPPDPSQEPSPGSGTDQPDDDDDTDTEASGFWVDRVAYEQLEQRAGMVARLQEEDRIRTRDDLINGAIRAGQFPPSRREHYAARYDSDAEATTREIRRMRRGVVPVELRGSSATSDDEVATDAYPKEWVTGGAAPSEDQPQSTNGNGGERRSRVTQE